MATAKFYGADQSALQQWFNVVDADRSGEVNTAELQQALAQGGLNFSMKLASSMIRMFDDDRNAQLRFDEFVKLHAYLVNCQRTFARADADKNNFLDLNEIFNALTTLGFELDRSPGGAFYTLCQSYDFDRRGVIQLDSFIAMCVTLHNAKRLHASLADPATPGRSSFDFNQFVWAVALL
jgi:Ca2+-binding EF-hand superfamily protein